MFGGKKKHVGKPQVTDVENLNFDDLVALGLIDEGLAVSIQDYIGKEEKALKVEPVAESQQVKASDMTNGKNVKVMTFPEKVSIVPDPPSIDQLEEQKKTYQEGNLAALSERVPSQPEARTVVGETSKQQELSELEEVLVDARRFAKREREEAQKKAAAIISEAKEKAQLHEIEMQQRELILNKKYQREILILKNKFKQMAEYFEAMQQNTQQLLEEYRQQTEELLRQLEELDSR